MFPFIWNSGVFDLSHQRRSVRILDMSPFFLLLLTTQYKYAGWVLTCATSVENWISVERFKSSNTALLSITLNASFGGIQILRYHKMTKIWTPSPLVHTCSILIVQFYSHHSLLGGSSPLFLRHLPLDPACPTPF